MLRKRSGSDYLCFLAANPPFRLHRDTSCEMRCVYRPCADMDGLEATRLLKERLPPSEMPTVVALTADTMQDLPKRCLAAGMSDFVAKPFKVEDVQRVLALVIPCTESVSACSTD